MTKTIASSVGDGGLNRPDDVALVQYLLNCVAASAGGPKQELAVDGLCGPKTLGAILGFQRVMFGAAKGRIDPQEQGGSMMELLNGYDPAPLAPLHLAALGTNKSKSGKSEGKGGGSAAGGSGKDSGKSASVAPSGFPAKSAGYPDTSKGKAGGGVGAKGGGTGKDGGYGQDGKSGGAGAGASGKAGGSGSGASGKSAAYGDKGKTGSAGGSGDGKGGGKPGKVLDEVEKAIQLAQMNRYLVFTQGGQKTSGKGGSTKSAESYKGKRP